MTIQPSIRSGLIFGRAPAAIVGLIEAILALALAFGIGLTPRHSARSWPSTPPRPGSTPRGPRGTRCSARRWA